MSSPFVAEIRMFGCNFAPVGWAMCNGQILPISQNTALFSLLGTFYGGNGQSTFALPNLQDNAPMGTGQGAGLSERFLGETSGSQTVTLLTTEIPLHTHSLSAYTIDPGDNRIPAPNMALAAASPGNDFQTNTSANLVAMSPQALGVTGGSLPHNNMQPFLTVLFCIAMQGVFPPRS